MAIPHIPQGSDIIVNITVSDASGVIDLDTLSGIAVWVAKHPNGKVMQKFSQNTLTGFSSLTIVDAAHGQLSFQIDAVNTRTAQAGEYFVEVKQQTLDGYDTFTSVSTQKIFMKLTDAISVATSSLS